MALQNIFSVTEAASTELKSYIDTLFAKVKSIVGITCAQIFTDGEFVQMFPMISR